ncbi:hypothetical protein M082_6268 [Bacteroides fragilis str. 3725 D9 ii]|nr:hypothetical protein M082_6268 [Bacteroides fragilis str. 3725 D9 ii]
MFIRYFLGNGIIFATKIGKNINSKQTINFFFSFFSKICNINLSEHEG